MRLVFKLVLLESIRKLTSILRQALVDSAVCWAVRESKYIYVVIIGEIVLLPVMPLLGEKKKSSGAH